MGMPKTVEEVQAHFSKELTAEEISLIEENMPHYAFMNDRDSQRYAWCSCCHQHVDLLIKHKHNEEWSCPKCGALIKIKHIWRGISTLESKSFGYIYMKSVLDPTIITARGVWAYRTYRNHYLHPETAETEYITDSYHVFVPGEGAVHVRPYNGARAETAQNLCEAGVTSQVFELCRSKSPRWNVYKNMNGWGYNNDYVSIKSIRRAVKETYFQYIWDAAEKEYLKYGKRGACLELFHMAAKYKSIEWLLKMGLGANLCRLFEDKEYGRVFYWRGKTVDAVMRAKLTKQDKKMLLKDGASTGDIMAWQNINKYQTVSLVDVSWMDIPGYIMDDIKLIASHANMKKLSAYLMRQMNMQGDAAPQWGLYRDYLSAADIIELDLKSKSVLYPKNLIAAHDNTVKQMRLQKNEIMERKYQHRLPELIRKYTYAADGYQIIVPAHVNDLITEGKMMSNCVGTYIERVAKGKTDVMFIRRADELQKSLGTMEVRNGTIIQARAKNNGRLDEKTQAFVERFRMECLEKKPLSKKEMRVTA